MDPDCFRCSSVDACMVLAFQTGLDHTCTRLRQSAGNGLEEDTGEFQNWETLVEGGWSKSFRNGVGGEETGLPGCGIVRFCTIVKTISSHQPAACWLEMGFPRSHPRSCIDLLPLDCRYTELIVAAPSLTREK